MVQGDDPQYGLLYVLRHLRTRDVGILPRIVLSLATGVFIAALLLAGAWLAAALLGKGLRPPYNRFDVDEYIATIAIALGGCAWLAVLHWIWRGAGRGRFPLGPILATLAIAIATSVGVVLIDEAVRSSEEILMAAAILLAVGIVFLIWLPCIQRELGRRSILTDQARLNIACPACSYSMIGLRESRCPECGTNYTIDELVLAQQFAVTTIPDLPRSAVSSAKQKSVSQPDGVGVA